MRQKIFIAALIVGGLQQPAIADVLSAINGARVKCQSGSIPPLKENKLLSTAAEKVSQGVRADEATHAAGYAMTNLASLHVGGVKEQGLQSLLSNNYCKVVGDAGAHDVGYFQHGSEVWILIGTARGDPGNEVTVANQALLLVNAARSKARKCGREQFNATTPLVLNPLLTIAAQVHSDEMARLRYVDHKGKDGSSPADRILKTGYQWRLVGENIAAGEDGVDKAVADWLSSPHHCVNVMNPEFKEMGIAFALIKNDMEYGVYWTQTFGTQKEVEAMVKWRYKMPRVK